MPVQQQRRAVDHGPAVDAVGRRTTARQRTSEVSNAANTVTLDRLPPRLLPTSPLTPSPVGQSRSLRGQYLFGREILQLSHCGFFKIYSRTH